MITRTDITMYKTKRGASLLLWTMCVVLTVCCVQTSNICQGKPADIVFVLDSSESITTPDFAHQLNFVKGVIDILDISSDKTHVGAVSFSNWAVVEFHLDTFHSKEAIKQAIDGIRHLKGDTNTASALGLMKDEFSGRGARGGTVPQIAVVLTDGKSNKPWHTAEKALQARQHGVHVFAIGIGEAVDLNELERIASSPKSKHVSHVSSYSGLTTSMAELLAIETCKVTARPTPPAATTTTTTTQATTTRKVTCGDAELVDIVFGVSPNSSPHNTVKVLKFFTDVSAPLLTPDEHVHVGLVPKECSAVPELNIRDFTDKTEIINNLYRMQIQSHRKTPVSVLRHMRLTSFKPEDGARPDAKKFAVLVIDKNDADSIFDLMREASRMQMAHNVVLYVVVVWDGLSQSDLDAMTPSPGHVINVSSYDELNMQVEHLREQLCPTAT